MVQIEKQFERHTSVFQKLEAELGEGEIIVRTGRGNDYMEIEWRISPERAFFDRLAKNPTLDDQEVADHIQTIKYTFEYNR